MRKLRQILVVSCVAVIAICAIVEKAMSETYNYVTQWGTLGTGNGQFTNPRGVAVDKNGNVFVNDEGNGRVQKFDSNGNFITLWSGYVLGVGGVGIPITTDLNGNVYNSAPSVNIMREFDNNGNLILQWGSTGSGNGQFDAIKGIAVDSNGYVYVGDQNNNRVQKFDKNGNFITQWGTQGSGNGQFSTPKGVAVDLNGNVFVCDWGNYRIQKFDSNGNYLTQWGNQGTVGGAFTNPYGIAVDRSGNVFVTDVQGANRIQKFDSNGNYLTQWGTTGSGNSQFDGPLGVAVDSIGNVYVSDEKNFRIQKFVPDCSITGTPPATGYIGKLFNFVPSSTNATRFDISGNLPLGLTFNSNNGSLSGTPSSTGTYSNIVISVSDGSGGTAFLPPFSIAVCNFIPPGPVPTSVPVMEGWWLLPGMLAGIGIFARRRKE